MLPLPSHFSFAGVVVPGAEFEAARGEDLLIDDDNALLLGVIVLIGMKHEL